MKRFSYIAIGFAALLGGCATTPETPSRQQDVCAIFAQNPDWRSAAHDASEQWNAPISVMMAIIWRESSFRHDARPPETTTFFGLVPTGHVSSAYGYSQALDGTWDWYLEDTGRSSFLASRTDFDDAIDFVGWYMSKTNSINDVAMNDAVRQYLAYHEGHGGFRRGTYRSKEFLLRASRQVGNMAQRYRGQIDLCGGDGV